MTDPFRAIVSAVEALVDQKRRAGEPLVADWIANEGLRSLEIDPRAVELLHLQEHARHTARRALDGDDPGKPDAEARRVERSFRKILAESLSALCRRCLHSQRMHELLPLHTAPGEPWCAQCGHCCHFESELAALSRSDISAWRRRRDRRRVRAGVCVVCGSPRAPDAPPGELQCPKHIALYGPSTAEGWKWPW